MCRTCSRRSSGTARTAALRGSEQVRASTSSPCAATSWTSAPTARCFPPRASCCTPATARSSTRSSARSLASCSSRCRRCRRQLADSASRMPAARPRSAETPRDSRGGRIGPRLLERLWRLRRGRARIRRAAHRQPLDAAALDQCHLQQVVRLPHLGRGRVVHLEPQQPRLPADAVVERSGPQPAGRGDLHLRPCVAAAPSRPSPLSPATRSVDYEARHGQGYSVFSATRGNLAAELTQLVDPADPVKISRLAIRNDGPIAGTAARLRLCRMGAGHQPREDRALHRAVARRRRPARCMARNPYSPRVPRPRRVPGAARPPRSR